MSKTFGHLNMATPLSYAWNKKLFGTVTVQNARALFLLMHQQHFYITRRRLLRRWIFSTTLFNNLIFVYCTRFIQPMITSAGHGKAWCRHKIAADCLTSIRGRQWKILGWSTSNAAQRPRSQLSRDNAVAHVEEWAVSETMLTTVAAGLRKVHNQAH